jgi:hypothetical protein
MRRMPDIGEALAAASINESAVKNSEAIERTD